MFDFNLNKPQATVIFFNYKGALWRYSVWKWLTFMGMSFTIAEMDLKPTLALVSTADTV